MKRWMGRWLMVVAVLHTAFGLVLFRAQWVQLLDAGLFNGVAGDVARAKAVWFGFFGLALFLFGLAVDALENVRAPMPTAIGAAMVIFTLLGILLVPASGFWLVLPLSIAALVKARRGPTAPA
jgi:Family of unknown function (DUF6463)